MHARPVGRCSDRDVGGMQGSGGADALMMIPCYSYRPLTSLAYNAGTGKHVGFSPAQATYLEDDNISYY